MDDTLLKYMAEHEPGKLALIQSSLSLAVPFHIFDMQNWDWERIKDSADACSLLIASCGDQFLYKTKRQVKQDGEVVSVGTAAAFNAVAKGIACLAFAPGGVRIFGLHFDAARGPLGIEREPTLTEAAAQDSISSLYQQIDGIIAEHFQGMQP